MTKDGRVFQAPLSMTAHDLPVRPHLLPKMTARLWRHRKRKTGAHGPQRAIPTGVGPVEIRRAKGARPD